MRVALVTVPPRFDPEREEWYVDLSVSPSAVPEAFVRLGLVRYQPHTDPDRRCSLPVVQWTQPLPDRLLDVRPGNNGGLIVQITGTAPSRQTDGPAAEKQGIVSNRQPRMRVTLFAETRDSDGRLLRREVSTTIVALDAKAKPIGRGDRWQWTTQLDSEKLKNAARPNRDGSLPEVVLFVEEIEAFLPAEHAKEPISPGESVTTGPSAETGPRYSQRILLQPMLNLIGFTQKVTGVV